MRKWIDIIKEAEGERLSAEEIQDQIGEYDYEDTGPQFEVMQHDPATHDPVRPLAIVVHPGDMIETDDGWSDDEDAENVVEYSRINQDGTGSELRSLQRNGCDFVVLNRSSCSQFAHYRNSVSDDLREQLSVIWDDHTTLFGDDLETAARWIIQHCHIAERPMVYMLGAYSDYDNGCLTFIGQAIQQVVGKARIKVSSYSPGGNCSDAKVWRPNVDGPVPHSAVRWKHPELGSDRDV